MSMSVSFSPMPPVQAVQTTRAAQRDEDDRAAQSKRDDEAQEAAKSEASRSPDRTSGGALDITA